jgi:hypothetical protein
MGNRQSKLLGGNPALRVEHALEHGGVGSAKRQRTTGRSASARDRPSSTFALSPQSIIATNHSVQTWAEAAIAPDPPISASGNRYASSPPRTWKPSGPRARISSVSMSIPPTACLMPATPGMAAIDRIEPALMVRPVRYGML